MHRSALVLISSLFVVGAAGADCSDGAPLVPCGAPHRKALALVPAPGEALRQHEAKGDDDTEFGLDDGLGIGIDVGGTAADSIYDHFYVPRNPNPT